MEDTALAVHLLTLIKLRSFWFSLSHSLWPHSLYLSRMRNQDGHFSRCADVAAWKQRLYVKTTQRRPIKSMVSSAACRMEKIKPQNLPPSSIAGSELIPGTAFYERGHRGPAQSALKP